jgi:hypothetical protein
LDQSGSLKRDGNGLEEGWNVLESESERKRRELSRKKRTLTTQELEIAKAAHDLHA